MPWGCCSGKYSWEMLLSLPGLSWCPPVDSCSAQAHPASYPLALPWTRRIFAAWGSILPSLGQKQRTGSLGPQCSQQKRYQGLCGTACKEIPVHGHLLTLHSPRVQKTPRNTPLP